MDMEEELSQEKTAQRLTVPAHMLPVGLPSPL